MPYTIKLSDGVTTLVTVPDRQVIGPLALNAPSNCPLNLVGRGAQNYGFATATNFVWLLQNFANITPPISPLAGQLWYDTNNVSPTLQLFNTSNQWTQIATADAPFTFNGNLTVSDGLGDSVTIGDNGIITLIRADYTPRIVFEGIANATNSVTLELGTDQYGNPDLTINMDNTVNAIWHSGNLTPDAALSADSVFTGFDTFTKPTHFAEVIVDVVNGAINDVAKTDILPGSITLKNNNTGTSPLISFLSANPYSTATATISFADPNLLVNFASNSSTSGLVVNGGGAFINYLTLNGANVLTTAYAPTGFGILDANNDWTGINTFAETRVSELNSTSGITVINGGGGIQLFPGDSTHTGYVQFADTSGDQMGYMGYGIFNSGSQWLQLSATNPFIGYQVTGQLYVAEIVTLNNGANINGTVAVNGQISSQGTIQANSGNLRADYGASSSTGGSGSDNNVATLLGDFPFNADDPNGNATGGYMQLPNGFIIQWFSVIVPTQSLTDVTFPYAFPNNCLMVVGNVGSIYLNSTNNGYICVGVQGVASSYCQVRVATPQSGSSGCFFIAMGY
ncbi:unnamed protein product [Sphagnum tenellum]